MVTSREKPNVAGGRGGGWLVRWFMWWGNSQCSDCNSFLGSGWVVRIFWDTVVCCSVNRLFKNCSMSKSFLKGKLWLVLVTPGWGNRYGSMDQLWGQTDWVNSFSLCPKQRNLIWFFFMPLNPGNPCWTSQALSYKGSLQILKYDAFLMWKLCTELWIIEYWPHFSRQRGDDWLEIYQLNWSGYISASFVQERNGIDHWCIILGLLKVELPKALNHCGCKWTEIKWEGLGEETELRKSTLLSAPKHWA